MRIKRSRSKRSWQSSHSRSRYHSRKKSYRKRTFRKRSSRNRKKIVFMSCKSDISIRNNLQKIQNDLWELARNTEKDNDITAKLLDSFQELSDKLKRLKKR